MKAKQKSLESISYHCFIVIRSKKAGGGREGDTKKERKRTGREEKEERKEGGGTHKWWLYMCNRNQIFQTQTLKENEKEKT